MYQSNLKGYFHTVFKKTQPQNGIILNTDRK